MARFTVHWSQHSGQYRKRQAVLMGFVGLVILILSCYVDATYPTDDPANAQHQYGELSETAVLATMEHAKRQLEGKLSDGSSALSPMVQTTLQDLATDMKVLTDSLRGLQEVYMHFQEKQVETEKLIRDANAREVQHFVDRLSETLKKETELRKRKEAALTRGAIDDEDEDDDDDDDDDDFEPAVTTEMLEERLDTFAVMEETEIQMRNWIMEVVEEELLVYKGEVLEKPMAIASAATAETNGVGSGNVCPTTGEILGLVQQSLQRYADDGIGLVDHAQQGAKVVHTMTSNTYTPPPLPSQTLGSVWWRSFIPQDWENLLPEGWEHWNVGIPSYVYHSLGWLAGNVAPPETVLDPKVLPGSCWPMAGSTGQVTLKLKHPVVVESVSVDHVSWEITPEGKHMSAPKLISVIGYPPCDKSDKRCVSLGFDIADPIEVARVTYNVEGGPSVQTFDSHFGLAMKNLAEHEEDNNDEDDHDALVEERDDPASCSSEEATSCSAPPRISVAGVTFKVLQNWGNPDFTCLYRLRIH